MNAPMNFPGAQNGGSMTHQFGSTQMTQQGVESVFTLAGERAYAKVSAEQNAQQLDHPLPLTTNVLAAKLGVQPQTLRAALCRNGHYYGLRPWKTPSGRLLWPANSIQRLASGEAA
jgi:hypothetical protein